MRGKLKVLIEILKKTHHIVPGYILLQLLLAFFQLILVFIGIYLPSIAIDILQAENSVTNAILQIGIYLGILLLVRMIITLINTKLLVLNELIQHYMTAEVNEQLLDVPYEQMEDPKFVDQISNAVEPISNLRAINNLFISLPKLIQYIVTIVGVITIVFLYNAWIVVIVVLASLIQFVINRQGVKKETEYARMSFKLNKEYWYYLRTMRDPVIAKDVRIYQMQPFLSNKIKQVYDNFVYGGSKEYGIRDLRALVGKVFSTLLMAFMYLFLLYSSVDNALTPSYLILLVNSSTTLFMTLNLLQSEMLLANQSIIYLAEYVKFNEIVKKEKHTGTRMLDEPIETIEFRNITFAYPKTDVNVLKDLNMIIDKKQTVSIVGRNGSGKTTMIKLLSRLYKPTAGSILVNGVDIEDYDYTSYLKQLSIIFQDFRTFNTTIKDNITFGNVDEMQLDEAVENADFKKELKKFSKGLDTYVGKDVESDGVQLSKGQEQKLAIARNIYKDGSLMILDEPTASLDPLAEEEVYRHFEKITNSKLSIMISHRLSSCRSSDLIMLIENGVVKEKGNHDELIALNGSYAQMYTLQSSKYQKA